MINRQNWQDVKAFLAFHEGTLQNDATTIHRLRGALRHLLEWSDSTTFGNVRTLEPTFPAYLASRKDEAGKPYKVTGSEKTLQIARQFFDFARSEWNPRYRGISESWIYTLKPAKRNSAQSRLKEHKHFAFDEVMKIAALKPETLEVKRNIAAVCFLFLSGMRISAFMSLPINCVNIADNEISQLPEKGVRTKNRKAAITYLLQIPELLKVVTEWDNLVRAELLADDLWYPVMRGNTDKLDSGRIATANRRTKFSQCLRALCDRAGVPYLSPHKIRHGHVVYALKNVKDLAGLKAISQNVMHESIQITDSIYGNLSGGDVKRVISAIGTGVPGVSEQSAAPADMQSLIMLFSVLLKDNPEAMKLLANFGKPTTA